MIVFEQIPPGTTEISQLIKILNRNFDKVKNSLNNIAGNLLASVVNNSQPSTASSSYVLIQGFSNISFSSNGGLVCIDANFATRVTAVNNQIGCIGMFLDGNEITSKLNFQGGAGGDSSGQAVLSFCYRQKMAKGSHNLTFKFKVTGGATFQLNLADGGFEKPNSEVFVTEISQP